MDGGDQGNWSRNTGVPNLIANLIVMVIVNHQRHTTIACGRQDKTTNECYNRRRSRRHSFLKNEIAPLFAMSAVSLCLLIARYIQSFSKVQPLTMSINEYRYVECRIDLPANVLPLTSPRRRNRKLYLWLHFISIHYANLIQVLIRLKGIDKN